MRRLIPAMPSGCSLKFMMDAMPDVHLGRRHLRATCGYTCRQQATQGLEGVSIAHLFAHGHTIWLFTMCRPKSTVVLFRSYTLIWRRWPNHMVVTIAYMRCVPHMIECAYERRLRTARSNARHHQNKTSYHSSIRYLYMKEQCLSMPLRDERNKNRNVS
jgi:hypothetical protein